jgi:hypothetical protein
MFGEQNYLMSGVISISYILHVEPKYLIMQSGVCSCMMQKCGVIELFC